MRDLQGGEGGGGGGGGEGGGEGGEGGGRHQDFGGPPTDSPNPFKEAKLHRRTLGLIYRFAQRDPPPPHDGGGSDPKIRYPNFRKLAYGIRPESGGFSQ